ncbi:MAG: nucleotidyltransferase domain-containing protein [Desulfovibrio sp.]|jgi:predicted nucleotidyltransferase|nr:nucleotidyltransferase domain-containing protein [Desulfovibrio sp.]
MDKSQIVNTVRRYAEAVIQEFQPEAILLFGSSISGVVTEKSDIDVAVVYERFDGNFWEASTRLYTLRRGISSLIEPHLLDRSDDKSGFVEEVMKTGETIYMRDDRRSGNPVAGTRQTGCAEGAPV